MNVALRRLLFDSSARSQLLTGLRGMGKTVILVELQELADANGYFHAHLEVTEDGILGVLKALSLRIPNEPELSIEVDAVFGPADSGNLGADPSGLFVELGRAAKDPQTGIPSDHR